MQNIGKEGAWKELERVKGRVTAGEERGSIWVFPESPRAGARGWKGLWSRSLGINGHDFLFFFL